MDIWDYAEDQRAKLAVIERTVMARMQGAYDAIGSRARAQYDQFSEMLTTWQAQHPGEDPSAFSPQRYWLYQQERYANLLAQIDAQTKFYQRYGVETTLPTLGESVNL